MHEGIEAAHLAVEETIRKIEFIKQQVAVEGANNYEIPELNNLLEKVKAGDISPEQGLREAEIIQESKNSYH